MKNHSREEQEQAMALVSQLFVIFEKLSEAKKMEVKNVWHVEQNYRDDIISKKVQNFTF